MPGIGPGMKITECPYCHQETLLHIEGVKNCYHCGHWEEGK